MAGFFSNIWKNIKGPAFKGPSRDFLAGTPEERENVSTLLPRQESTLRDVTRAARRPGSPGVYGQAADIYRDLPNSEAANYYRGNLGNNPADFAAFAAPDVRNFNENIAPGIAEQYAGLGSGGLSSSSFRNAQTQAGTDLSERLAKIRAGLRENSAANLNNINLQSAQGLQGIGNTALGNYSQNMVTRQGSPGFLSEIAPAVGAVAGTYFGGPAGGALGYQAGQSIGKGISGQNTTNSPGLSYSPNMNALEPQEIRAERENFRNQYGITRGNKVGANSGPYGNTLKASPTLGNFR